MFQMKPSPILIFNTRSWRSDFNYEEPPRCRHPGFTRADWLDCCKLYFSFDWTTSEINIIPWILRHYSDLEGLEHLLSLTCPAPRSPQIYDPADYQ